MGLFNKILSKLGINKDKAGATSASASASKPAAKPAGASSSAKAPASSGPTFSEKMAAQKKPASSASRAIPEVDVVKQLEELGAGKGLNWKVSIVDLLKLLDLDSSREARNELATELGCPADLMNDSAKMNVWLHKTVLKKIADNGGNIPQDLLS